MTKKTISLHEKRGITFAELGALYGVLGLIDAGLLVHTPHCYVARPGEHAFNMSVQLKVESCGSVGCIGGAVAQIMGMDQHTATRYVGIGGNIGTASEALQDLYFPPVVDKRTGSQIELWDTITLPEAAQAIRNFLRTGKPAWLSILGTKRARAE